MQYRIDQWATQTALAEWVGGLFCMIETIKIVCVGLNPPSHRWHSPGYDQAPNQRQVLLHCPSLQVMRSFTVVHTTSDLLVECLYIVFLSTYFPFLSETAEQLFWWDSTPALLALLVEKITPWAAQPLAENGSLVCAFKKKKWVHVGLISLPAATTLREWIKPLLRACFFPYNNPLPRFAHVEWFSGLRLKNEANN